MSMTTIRQASAIAKRQLELRNELWPEVAAYLWDRKAFTGFATIPKTMPLILKIMDEMTKNAPVASTYLSLWCATWDNSFVTITKPRDLAYEAGFTGQRAEYTWKSRMRILQELNFIDLKSGMSSEFRHAIIWNPHLVIRWHHRNRTPGLTESSYTALLEKALDIGAKDMTTAVRLPEQIGCPSPASDASDQSSSKPRKRMRARRSARDRTSRS